MSDMRTRQPTWLALFLSFLAFLALARLGHAATKPPGAREEAKADPAPKGGSLWQEVHAAGVDVRVTVDRDAKLSAELHLAYRVVAGTLRAVELEAGSGLAFEPQGTVTFEDGASLPLFVVQDDKGKLHLTVDDAKGLKRGNYTFIVRATQAARSAPAIAADAMTDLRSDGAFLELSFRAPAQREGVDGMRIVFDLPSAPTEPQAKSDGAANDAILSTLRRKADRDELELVRPHVGRGEAATFKIRVDRKALSALDAPSLQAPPPAVAPARTHDTTLIFAGCALAALGLLALLRAKATALATRARGAELRPLAPLPLAVAPFAAALAFGATLWAELAEKHLVAGVLLAGALVLTAVRVRPRRARILAPGAWTAAAPDALVPGAPSPFDGTRARGARFLGLAVLGVVLAAWFVRHLRADAAWLVVLDASLLVPLFFTGTESQLGATVARTAQLLRRCQGALAKTAPVSTMAHVPRGAAAPDEVRLLTVPPLAMPGLVGIELGVAWEESDGAPAPRYGVLVRVLDDSAASAKLAAELKDVSRPVTGRRPEERVYALWPRLPLAGAAVGLVEELADVLRDRRTVVASATAAPWSGRERRLAPVDVAPAAG